MHKQTKLFEKTGVSRRLKLGVLAIALIALVSTGLVIGLTETGILGGVINNSVSTNPPTAVGSPLLVIREDSLGYSGITPQGNDPNLFVQIGTIDWPGMYGASTEDSFVALNHTGICLYDNSSEVLHPAWTVAGLPTGYELTCYVRISETSGSLTTPPSWYSGYVWKQSDYNAWTLQPRSAYSSWYYRMVFVLTTGPDAIPGELNFQISFSYTTA